MPFVVYFVLLFYLSTLMVKSLVVYAYYFIPYRSQPAKRARLIRSRICSLQQALGMADSCQHYGTPPPPKVVLCLRNQVDWLRVDIFKLLYCRVKIGCRSFICWILQKKFEFIIVAKLYFFKFFPVPFCSILIKSWKYYSNALSIIIKFNTFKQMQTMVMQVEKIGLKWNKLDYHCHRTWEVMHLFKVFSKKLCLPLV